MYADPSYFESPRAKLFWAVVGVLVLVQVVALYLLCDSQMSKARDRQAALHQQQVAINDCLRYSSDTIGACMRRSSAKVEGDAPSRGTTAMASAAPAVLSTAMPVNFSYR
jgi:Tfp pilus assembly protein PilN